MHAVEVTVHRRFRWVCLHPLVHTRPQNQVLFPLSADRCRLRRDNNVSSHSRQVRDLLRSLKATNAFRVNQTHRDPSMPLAPALDPVGGQKTRPHDPVFSPEMHASRDFRE